MSSFHGLHMEKSVRDELKSRTIDYSLSMLEADLYFTVDSYQSFHRLYSVISKM